MWILDFNAVYAIPYRLNLQDVCAVCDTRYVRVYRGMRSEYIYSTYVLLKAVCSSSTAAAAHTTLRQGQSRCIISAALVLTAGCAFVTQIIIGAPQSPIRGSSGHQDHSHDSTTTTTTIDIGAISRLFPSPGAKKRSQRPALHQSNHSYKRIIYLFRIIYPGPLGPSLS